MESSLRRTKREQHGRFVPKPGSRNSRSNLPRDAVYGDQYPGLSILPVAKSQTLCIASTSLKSAPIKTSAPSQFPNPYVSVEGFGFVLSLSFSYKQEVAVLIRPTS